MSDEIGPIPQAGVVVFYNPDDLDQVRKVTATAAWQDLTAATFADCAVTLTQKGTTGQYFADLPTGLSASRPYTFALYASDATAFSDASDVMGYAPEVTPLIGSGANLCTQTITNTTTGFPVADADVWITTDAAGANVVAGTLQTNSIGKVTFLLDAGSPYYLWMQKDEANPIQGELFTAEAD